MGEHSRKCENCNHLGLQPNETINTLLLLNKSLCCKICECGPSILFNGARAIMDVIARQYLKDYLSHLFGIHALRTSLRSSLGASFDFSIHY